MGGPEVAAWVFPVPVKEPLDARKIFAKVI
jgi:hypothetical protein